MSYETKSINDLVLKTVGSTYGPKGRTVMIERSSGVISTKDGHAVFWELWPKNRKDKAYLNLIQEAISRLNQLVGDGTTTATLFICLLLQQLEKWKIAGENVQEISKDLLNWSKKLDGFLFPLKREIKNREDLFQYGLSVANQDREIAFCVSEALLDAGHKGLVSVEEGKARKIEKFLRKGYKIEKGYESEELATNGERVFEECLVACVDSILETSEQVTPLLEEASQFPYPLLVISRGVYGEALQTLILNDKSLNKTDGSKLEVCAIRVPGRPDQQRSYLEDLAAMSGSTIWVPEYFSFESSMLGAFEKSIVKRNQSTVYSYSDKEEGILRRISKLESFSSESSHDQDELNRRIAMLSEGFVVLEIGGATEYEIKERRGRVEDVLSVLKIALEEGIVPGGAMSYLWLWNSLKESEKVTERALALASKNLWMFLMKENHVILDKLDPTNPWVGYDLVQERARDFREPPLLAESYVGFQKTLEIACSVASEIILIDRIILK